MFLEAIFTAVIVSIDGFLIGVALGIKKTKIMLNKLLIIAIIPILMAFPVMILGNYVSSLVSSKFVNIIGSILFLFLSINSFRQIKKEDNTTNYLNILNSIIIGITIGIDSSISAFSLALNMHNSFITPFYFGISHGILIYLGNLISFRKKILNVLNI